MSKLRIILLSTDRAKKVSRKTLGLSASSLCYAYELGGVWLGASKDATVHRKSSDIIVIAFGKPFRFYAGGTAETKKGYAFFGYLDN